MSHLHPPIASPWPPRLRVAGWSLAAALLLLPMIAMQVTSEVAWDVADFAFAAVMIAATGGTQEFLARKSSGPSYLLAGAIAVGTAFLLVWIDAAVGIVGGETDDGNLIFAAVIATAIGGACLARFRAGGLAKATVATAVVQGLVGFIALFAFRESMTANDPRILLSLTAIFVALWLASAWLFARAARS